MNAGGFASSTSAEQIKWWNAMDTLSSTRSDVDAETGMQMVRECQHPDAQWVAALFPVGEAVTRRRMAEAMLEQSEDVRAIHLGGLADEGWLNLVLRAAAMGYAPAQAVAAGCVRDDGDAFLWAQRAAEQGERYGYFQLGYCLSVGKGCARDRLKAVQLFKEAAELEHARAQYHYGLFGFGELDWRRFMWWGRAARRINEEFFSLAVLHLLPSFEKDELGRILHTAGMIIRANLDVANQQLFGLRIQEEHRPKLHRVMWLYERLLGRARDAIACWSMASRRHGVVKDIRVMIAKMAWEEVWLWGERA
jgi:TPR repeat protein